MSVTDIEVRIFSYNHSLLSQDYRFKTKIPYFGAHGDEETPVPIPNTEVKLISGDYTAQVGN